MPHLRRRHLESLLVKTLNFSPIVGLFGHRQVGKTTLASALSEKYTTLDTAASLADAVASPESFLARNAGQPLVIDECQMAAPLFPAMKEWVRTRKKPGQFLLTGSVRLSARKAIRESLTGRIVTWELLPMDMAEMDGSPLPQTLPSILSSQSLGASLITKKYFTPKYYETYCIQGGLPGVFGTRDPVIANQRFETQINTLMERDLKLLTETKLPFRTLRAFLASLAQRIGAPLEILELSREARISAPTVRKLLGALEAMFVIRIIPTKGAFTKPTLFFEDMGEANHLAPFEPADPRKLISFLFQNLRPQVAYRPQLGVEFFQFRGRNGACVPLCAQMKKKVLGIIPVDSSAALGTAVDSARTLLREYPDARVLLVSSTNQDEMVLPRVRWIGAGRLV